jgi:hypothetical protein
MNWSAINNGAIGSIAGEPRAIVSRTHNRWAWSVVPPGYPVTGEIERGHSNSERGAKKQATESAGRGKP